MKKREEIDFVIELDEKTIPFEIKFGKNNPDSTYDHIALSHCLEDNRQNKQAYIFGETNVFHENDRIIDFPIYLISFLVNDKINPFLD